MKKLLSIIILISITGCSNPPENLEQAVTILNQGSNSRNYDKAEKIYNDQVLKILATDKVMVDLLNSMIKINVDCGNSVSLLSYPIAPPDRQNNPYCRAIQFRLNETNNGLINWWSVYDTYFQKRLDIIRKNNQEEINNLAKQILNSIEIKDKNESN